MKLFFPDPDKHEMKFEYLRFEPGFWLPATMQIQPHIAVKVENNTQQLFEMRRISGKPNDYR